MDHISIKIDSVNSFIDSPAVYVHTIEVISNDILVYDFSIDDMLGDSIPIVVNFAHILVLSSSIDDMLGDFVSVVVNSAYILVLDSSIDDMIGN